MSDRVRHPGYSAAWGSTSEWFGDPPGRYVAVTYSPPGTDGLSEREESYHDHLKDAETVAREARS